MAIGDGSVIEHGEHVSAPKEDASGDLMAVEKERCDVVRLTLVAGALDALQSALPDHNFESLTSRR